MRVGIYRTLLEKGAVDNGFDRELGDRGEWLAFGSTRSPLEICLHPRSARELVVGFSQPHVGDALDGHGIPIVIELPEGFARARVVTSVEAMNGLVRRAFQLARSLPSEPLRAFEAETARLPRSTEAERLVIQRVGQDIFRRGLVDFWEGRCAVTGLDVEGLLRASHIKPWSRCEADAERLDVFNGLLLAPNLDAAFDRGMIGFKDDGALSISNALPCPARDLLGIKSDFRLRAVDAAHQPFLAWHRANLFKQ